MYAVATTIQNYSWKITMLELILFLDFYFLQIYFVVYNMLQHKTFRFLNHATLVHYFYFILLPYWYFTNKLLLSIGYYTNCFSCYAYSVNCKVDNCSNREKAMFHCNCLSVKRKTIYFSTPSWEWTY